MKALVIGYGSIGARHARLLSSLGHETAVVSRRSVSFPKVFPTVESAFNEKSWDYVVVANETTEHLSSVQLLETLGFPGKLLIEKPLFEKFYSCSFELFSRASVAYNLRFHPLIRRLRKELEGQKVLSVNAYVGSYLPLWRPDSDYRSCYSAHASKGGGVLRDLSHELDYLLWLFGNWEKVTAHGGHLSSLEISSDDVFSIMLTTVRSSVVHVELNYLDRGGRRSMVVNTDTHTYEIDFIRGTFLKDNVLESVTVERDDTYLLMHKEALSDNQETLCSFQEGLETLKLIEAVEVAAREDKWVRR